MKENILSESFLIADKVCGSLNLLITYSRIVDLHYFRAAIYRIRIYNNSVLETVTDIAVPPGRPTRTVCQGVVIMSIPTARAGLTTRLTRLQSRAPDFLGAPKWPRKNLNEFGLLQ